MSSDNDMALELDTERTGDNMYDLLQIFKIWVANGDDINVQNARGETCLLQTVKMGFKPVVDFLLENGAQVNLEDEDGVTPVCAAAANGDRGMLKYLLAAGADVNGNNISFTPLYWCVTHSNIESARLLMEFGAKFSAADIYDVAEVRDDKITDLLKELNADFNVTSLEGWTPLHWGVDCNDEEVVRHLVTAGADINVGLNNNVTPLYLSVRQNFLPIVIYLLESGADPNIADDDGITPLHIAVKNGHEEIVRLLLGAGADPNITTNEGATPLSEAIGICDLSIFNCLVKFNADINRDNRRLLYSAVSADDDAILRFLLNAGTNPDLSLKNGETALHIAVRLNNEVTVTHLVKGGASLDARDDDGRTALYVAGINKNINILKYLLKSGADANLTDNSNLTVLHNAVISGDDQMLECLLSSGVDTNKMCSSGFTALHQAVQHDNMCAIRQLLVSGADANKKTCDGVTPLLLAVTQSKDAVVKVLVEFGANINESDSRCNTPLLVSLNTKNFGIMKHLLESGAEVNCHDAKGNTALSIAIQQGNVDIVKYLVESGADVNQKDSDGRTPLHYSAVGELMNIVKHLMGNESHPSLTISEGLDELLKDHKRNDTGIIQCLVSSGADECSGDSKGRSPLKYAIISEAIDITRRLVVHVANPSPMTSKGLNELFEGVKRNNMEIIKCLVKFAGKKYGKDPAGQNLFHYTVLGDVTDIVQLLLRNVSDSTLKTSKDLTALTKCNTQNKEDVIKYFVESCIYFDFEDSDGTTPVHNAILGAPTGICKRLLEGCGPDPLVIKSEGYNAMKKCIKQNNNDNIKCLVDNAARVDHRDIGGHTLLHFTVIREMRDIFENSYEHIEDYGVIPPKRSLKMLGVKQNTKNVIKYLIKCGANVDSKDIWGCTPLHFAIMMESVTILHWLEIIKADLSLTTPASIAGLIKHCKGKNKDIVQCLVESGADVDSKDSHGRTPVHYALFLEMHDIAEQIELHVANSGRLTSDDLTEIIKGVKRDNQDIVNYLLTSSANANDYKGNTVLYYAMGIGKDGAVPIPNIPTLLNHVMYDVKNFIHQFVGLIQT